MQNFTQCLASLFKSIKKEKSKTLNYAILKENRTGRVAYQLKPVYSSIIALLMRTEPKLKGLRLRVLKTCLLHYVLLKASITVNIVKEMRRKMSVFLTNLIVLEVECFESDS